MSRRGWLLFLAMGVIWGIPYLLIKIAVTDLTPGTLVLFRTALGALILVPLAAARGEIRPLQPRELYKSQAYATAVYQSELAIRLRGLGYEIEFGKNHAPEIRGYSAEYLEASSPRRQQIEAHLEEGGLSGAGAAQVAAYRTRDRKELLSPEEVLAAHRELARQHGHPMGSYFRRPPGLRAWRQPPP